VEPEGRNTGPAVCAAVELIQTQDHDALVLICPADHVIADVMSFARAVAAAIPAATRGEIVTFGIRPDRPETGFGYIELSTEAHPDDLALPFVRFTEKPDAATAEAMVASAATSGTRASSSPRQRRSSAHSAATPQPCAPPSAGRSARLRPTSTSSASGLPIPRPPTSPSTTR
jgi:hypothetical protein